MPSGRHSIQATGATSGLRLSATIASALPMKNGAICAAIWTGPTASFIGKNARVDRRGRATPPFYVIYSSVQ